MYDDDDFDKTDDAAGLTPAQRELESALRDLRPAWPNIDRDRLLFDAGAASARRSTNLWRAAAAVLVVGNAVAMTFALRMPGANDGRQIASEPTPPAPTVVVEHPGERSRPSDHAVVAQARWDMPLPPPGQPLMPSADAGYLPVRDAVLRWGVAALPAPVGGPRASAQSQDIRELLDMPRQQEPGLASPWAPLSAPIKRLFSGDQL